MVSMLLSFDNKSGVETENKSAVRTTENKETENKKSSHRKTRAWKPKTRA